MFKKISIGILLIAILVWIGLPVVLQGLGLHPECPPFEGDLAGHSALVIATSHSEMCGESGGKTGVAASELLHPYYEFLDAGMDVARSRVLAWFGTRLEAIDLHNTQKDPKTRLQEFLQSRQQALPRYEVISVEGEAHAQTFSVECHVSMLDESPTLGEGSSRRIAEQQAAELALSKLEPSKGKRQ